MNLHPEQFSDLLSVCMFCVVLSGKYFLKDLGGRNIFHMSGRIRSCINSSEKNLLGRSGLINVIFSFMGKQS